MKEDKDIRQQPEAYPKPTKTDHQLKNQDEFIQLQNNRDDDQQPVLQEKASQERGFKDEGSGI
jgi:hypothetical protein